MTTLFLIYLFITCFMWAWFSITLQKKLHPERAQLWRLSFLFVANFISCPVAIYLGRKDLAQRQISHKETL